MAWIIVGLAVAALVRTVADRRLRTIGDRQLRAVYETSEARYLRAHERRLAQGVAENGGTVACLGVAGASLGR